MSIMYENIVRLCEQNHIKPGAMCRELGLSRGLMSDLKSERTKSLSAKNVALIANYFGVSTDQLMGEEKADPFGAGLDIIPYKPNHSIPILGRISAGLPLYADQQIEGYTVCDLNGGAEYFALKVQGDSMTAARINEGDTLIIRRQDIVENGSIAVVMVGDDEATVKQFYREGNIVTLMPRSMNPVHRPQIYDATKTKVRVIGLVVKNEITF